MPDKPSQPFSSRLIGALPVIGYGARCLAEGRYVELTWLGAVVAMAAVLVVLWFGFAGFITILQIMVALAALFILSATRAK
ncbi:MAG: hypothetical protein ACK5KM_12180 [Hyphomicrobiaceae bacterium]